MRAKLFASGLVLAGTYAVSLPAQSADPPSKGTYGTAASGVCSVHNRIAADALTTAAMELGRLRPDVDFIVSEQGVDLSDAGKARCASRGGCTKLQGLLSYQQLSDESRLSLSGELPFMTALRPHSLASVLTGVALPPPGSCASNAAPSKRIVAHELAFSKTMPAPAPASATTCEEPLVYRCFKVSGLPKNKTVQDLAASLRAAFHPHSELDQLTRALVNTDGELCIDPDGTGDDGIGYTYTPPDPPDCINASVTPMYDPSLTGACCYTSSSIRGYLVQNGVDPSYMSCRTTNFAFYRCATTDSADPAYLPNRVTDNDEDTNWKAADAGTNHYIEIDLGASVTTKGVVFKLEQAPPTGSSLAYKIETSVNHTLWATKGTASANQAWQNRGWAAGAVRWIKITVTSLPAGWTAGIGAVRVY